MAISNGTAKVVAYKKETNFGELASNTAGKQLRRVTADFNLTKEAYSSNEIRTSRQNASSTHGVRSAEGSLTHRQYHLPHGEPAPRPLCRQLRQV